MASVLQRGWSWLRAPANELAFAARSTLRWSRGRVVLRDQDQCGLFAHLTGAAARDAEHTAARLLARYDLAALAASSTRATFASSLAHLRGLERLAASLPLPLPLPFPPPLPGCGSAHGSHPAPATATRPLRAADVGCGDFHYATALQRWLARHGTEAPRAVALLGLEVDGHGVYRDGHSRADHARAHAALASGPAARVRFAVADGRRLRPRSRDVVTCLFPFVTAHACLRWGAPISRLAPRRLFAAAVGALRPGGWLIVVNQTGRELAATEACLAAEPVERLATAPWASDLVPWRERTVDQVGTLWRRRG